MTYDEAKPIFRRCLRELRNSTSEMQLHTAKVYCDLFIDSLEQDTIAAIWERSILNVYKAERKRFA